MIALVRALLILIAGSAGVVLLVFLVLLLRDIFWPEAGKFGASRFASRNELRAVLEKCGVRNPKLVRPGVLIKRGWAWEITVEAPQSNGRLRCMESGLRVRGRTAGIVGEWD
jgi:hypothetical protein